MASITSSTGASGLAIESIVSGLMSLERQPITNINTRVSAFESKISAFGTVKSGLSTFQTAVRELSTASKFNAQTATLSNNDALTTTADGTATNGSYSISVSQLAQSQKLASGSFTNVTDVVGSGTMTITFGTYAAATTGTNPTPASFTPNANKTALTLTIDSSNNTLAGIRDAINAQNASVSASIINDGTGNRLVITSKDTGEVNGLKITVTDADADNTNNSGLSALAYDPLATSGTGKNLIQLQQAQNAKLNIDGLEIVKPSNTITDAIAGVTLNLKTISATAATLTVASDTDKIKSSVQSFVDAYNKLNTSLRGLTKFDESGKSNGVLLGDATTRGIMTQLRNMMSQVSGTASTYKTLNDIGVSFQQDGSLKLDSTRLNTAVTNQLSDIAKLFAPSATTTDAQVSFVSNTSKTMSGTYAVNISQLGGSGQNVAGSINGVAGVGADTRLTGASNDNSSGLTLNIAGSTTGSRGTVTFSRGLAGELNNLIEDWLKDDGILDSKTDGLQSSVKRLKDQSSSIESRLVVIEKRLRAQYSKLDALLSSMQTTSNALSQQISALNKNSG